MNVNVSSFSEMFHINLGWWKSKILFKTQILANLLVSWIINGCHRVGVAKQLSDYSRRNRHKAFNLYCCWYYAKCKLSDQMKPTIMNNFARILTEYEKKKKINEKTHILMYYNKKECMNKQQSID